MMFKNYRFSSLSCANDAIQILKNVDLYENQTPSRIDGTLQFIVVACEDKLNNLESEFANSFCWDYDSAVYTAKP